VAVTTPIFYEFGFPLRIGNAEGFFGTGRALLWQDGMRWIAQGIQPLGQQLSGSIPADAIEVIIRSLERKIALCSQPQAGDVIFRERVNSLFARFAIRGIGGVDQGLTEWEEYQRALRGPADVELPLRYLAKTADIHGANWWTAPHPAHFRRFIVPIGSSTPI